MKRQVILTIVLVALVFGVIYGGLLVSRFFSDLVPAALENDGESAPVVRDDGLPLALPDGFHISIFAEGVEGARVMTRDPRGVMVVSLTRPGRIVALPDYDGDGRADDEVIVVEGLRRPHGMLFRCDRPEGGAEEACSLYVAEEHALSVYRYDTETVQAFGRRDLIALPTEGGGHFTRTLLEEPGGRLLVSVGSSCNVCSERDPRRAAILATDFDGALPSIFAQGLRNAVFMAVHPVTGEIWATEMGRDWPGDDLPPDEINIVREGGNPDTIRLRRSDGAGYGWPYCYGKGVQDVIFDASDRARQLCEQSIPSHIDIQAHSAPLGLAFVPEEGWPEEYWHDLLVAYHGSWNRSVPTGYKIMRFDLTEHGELQGREDFITGWLPEAGEVRGRPVDIRTEPGGIMYISDDHAGMIYRVVYLGED